MSIKKIFSLVFVFMFLLSVLTVSVNADDRRNIISDKVIEINEWDAYNRIVSMSDDELLNEGFTEQEISEIRNFNYEEEIRKRAALDDETLRLYGYSKNEIIELRQAAKLKSIPENTIKSISTATMSTILRYMDSYYKVENSANMYYCRFSFSWCWSRIPFFSIVDMVAVAYGSSTSDKFTYFSDSDNKVYTALTPVTTSSSTTYYQTESWQYSTSKPSSISAKFAVGLYDYDNNLTHFAFDGYGTFLLTNRSNNARLYLDACYGHTTINIVPAYSVSTSGVSVGINFIVGMDEQHCTGQFYEDFTITTNYIYYGTVYGKNNTGGTAS